MDRPTNDNTTPTAPATEPAPPDLAKVLPFAKPTARAAQPPEDPAALMHRGILAVLEGLQCLVDAEQQRQSGLWR